jgi:hypothetical protein
VDVYDPRQRQQLLLIDQVDSRCQRHGISAASARAALEPLLMAGGSEMDNGWELLRGSTNPQPHDPDEVDRLLFSDK